MRIFSILIVLLCAFAITGCFGKKTKIVEIEKPIIIEKPIEAIPQTCFVVQCSHHQRTDKTPICLRNGAYYWNHYEVTLIVPEDKKWAGPTKITFKELADRGFFYDNKGVWFEPFFKFRDGTVYGSSFLRVCSDVRRGP